MKSTSGETRKVKSSLWIMVVAYAVDFPLLGLWIADLVDHPFAAFSSPFDAGRI